jgi:phosphatidate cytidylyltransferase
MMTSETKTRVITGVSGAALLLFFIFVFGHIGICFVAAVLAGAICWELSQVFYTMSDRKEKTYALVGSSWLVIFVNMLFPKVMLECDVVLFIGLFMYYLASAERHPMELRRHFDEFVFTVFALMYAVTFMAFLPLVRDGINGLRWLILFLLIVWAGDTGAYFAGRKYGLRKLYPLISPGKSVEGAVGGLASSLAVSVLFKLLAFKSLGWLGALLTPIFVGVVSQIGDLCESFFKRAYELKDSGKILPGHGGVLDRFDGVLFSLPVMYFCVKVFG